MYLSDSNLFESFNCFNPLCAKCNCLNCIVFYRWTLTTIYTIYISLSHYVLCVHTYKIECIHVTCGFDYWLLTINVTNIRHTSFINKGIYFLMDSQQKGIKIMSKFLFNLKQSIFWWNKNRSTIFWKQSQWLWHIAKHS